MIETENVETAPVVRERDALCRFVDCALDYSLPDNELEQDHEEPVDDGAIEADAIETVEPKSLSMMLTDLIAVHSCLSSGRVESIETLTDDTTGKLLHAMQVKINEIDSALRKRAKQKKITNFM